MRYKFFSVLFFVSCIFLISCERDGVDPIGGKGGKATLRITPQHHGANIDSCMVYIKYNAQDKPALYDDSARCVKINGVPVATFSSLRKGKYYLFGYGWDPDIATPVKGGAPYEVKEETTLDYRLAVTEE